MTADINVRQISNPAEEPGFSREESAFANRLAAGETDGDLKRHPWPLPKSVAQRWFRLLVEQHGLTPDEATRYLDGDPSVLESVLARRDAARAATNAAD